MAQTINARIDADVSNSLIASGKQADGDLIDVGADEYGALRVRVTGLETQNNDIRDLLVGISDKLDMLIEMLGSKL